MPASPSRPGALVCLAALVACQNPPTPLRAVNDPALRVGPAAAILGALLVDGTGGPALADAVVVIQDGMITAVGPRGAVAIPGGADTVGAQGRTLLPGLIDAHFHLDGDAALPVEYLDRGVTSLRDPGAWIRAYDTALAMGRPAPRLFLTGPHLDGVGPAHPGDALVVRGADEARGAVQRFATEGASAIKLYYRLPTAEMAAATREAHRLGLPVTTHLEIVDVTEALALGVDGIEHITSFGTVLAGPEAADAYRRGVQADNQHRRNGRYAMWATIDPSGPAAERLAAVAGASGAFVVPTLAVFERRPGDPDTDSVQVHAFQRMVRFTSLLHKAGVPLLVGSHSSVPHAPRGGAYLRELELLVSAGLTPAEAIHAATLGAARAFRLDERLGSVEVGKRADLVLVEGNPLADIGHAGSVRAVMLNGAWVLRR